MKKFIFLTVALIAFVIFVVIKAMAGPGNIDKVESVDGTLLSNKCSIEPPRIEAMSTSKLSEVRALGDLDRKCGSETASTLMIFTIIPKDSIVAKKMAVEMAESLREYENVGISPLVVVEPDSDWGLIDFSEFNSGFYDNWIDDYFQELSALGINDQMLGTWVPFPEANLPYWNHQNTNPQEFSSAVNRYLSIYKRNFPDAKASILLNSATYPTDDYNWSEGEYVSLEPYVSGIDKDLIDSFGIQGFPWMPEASVKADPLFDPIEFMQIRLAKEAADILGIKKIWINTGTFAAKYAQEEDKKVIVPASIRKRILDDILIEANRLKNQGYEVSVNIFAEDKTQSAEATDWSYWGSEFTNNPGHEVALLDFLKTANSQEISVSLFLN